MEPYKALADMLHEPALSQSERREGFVREMKNIAEDRRLHKKQVKASEFQRKRDLDEPFELKGAL